MYVCMLYTCVEVTKINPHYIYVRVYPNRRTCQWSFKSKFNAQGLQVQGFVDYFQAG